MKILVIGDPHGTLPKKLDSIVKKNKIEIIICVGDIPYTPSKPWEKERWTKEVYKKYDKSYKEIIAKLCSYKIPLLVLRGNMGRSKDYNKKTKRIFRKYKNLFHKRTGKLRIYGKNFVFFDMVFEPSASRSGKKATKELKRTNKIRRKNLNRLLRNTKNVILISHAPPYGILDKVSAKDVPNEWIGRRGGSKILLKSIKNNPPNYVLCGHIHEGKGRAKIGKTTVINAGSSGDYFILNI